MIDIIDLAGMNRSVTMQEYSIRDGDAFLLVYSVCSRASFEAISKLHEQVLHFKRQISEGLISPIPMVVVGNQMDRKMEREVSTEEGQALGSALGCGFMETSAKDGNRVEAAFLGVLEQLVRQRSFQGTQDKNSPPRQKSDSRRGRLSIYRLPWSRTRRS